MQAVGPARSPAVETLVALSPRQMHTSAKKEVELYVPDEMKAHKERYSLADWGKLIAKSAVQG